VRKRSRFTKNIPLGAFRTTVSTRSKRLFPLPPADADRRESADGFTLVELLVVTAILGILMGLVAPALSALKGAADLTNTAETVKDALEHARNYAMANNTYVWVGLYEEDGSIPSALPSAIPGTGRVVLSVVASKDGSTIYDSNPAPIDPTRLTQVDKLIKIDNVHLPLFPVGRDEDDTFDGRPALQFDPAGVGYNASRFGELNAPGPNTAPYDTTNGGRTKFPFQYPVGSAGAAAQYTFQRTLQFNPRGECSINSTYKMRRVVEIGLQPARGNNRDIAARNVAAIQFSCVGGNFRVYRR
jgi:prepilin-type N-terminal cleavage/methylation domain-containing protein